MGESFSNLLSFVGQNITYTKTCPYPNSRKHWTGASTFLKCLGRPWKSSMSFNALRTMSDHSITITQLPANLHEVQSIQMYWIWKGKYKTQKRMRNWKCGELQRKRSVGGVSSMRVWVMDTFISRALFYLHEEIMGAFQYAWLLQTLCWYFPFMSNK